MKQKLDGGEEIAGGNKSFGDLPDELIEKILSLLPTKDAIRTSVLCKNWEYLWTSFPKLCFVDGPVDNRCALANAVERTLILRGPANIKEFTLSFPVRGDASRVNLWISAILKRNVEKLWLNLYVVEEPFSLALRLFTCATLRDLALYVTCILKVPSTVCFSSLRRFSLHSVVFSDDYSTQKLFSGCPVLEELSLINCNWAKLKFVTISASKLLSLIIYDTGSHLQISGGCCQIMVFGVSLKYFRYEGEFLNDYYFYNSSVHKAEILTTTSRLRHTSYRLYKLLREFSSMKILTTSSSSFEVVQTNAPELLPQMPLYNNLATLIFQAEQVNIGGKGLLRMFQKCPCLQTLVFSEGIRLSSNDGVLDPLPPCFLTSLKKIEVHGFDGIQVELNALKILLKNAMVLEKMIITCSDSFQGGPEKLRELSDLPRGSECCEVVCSLSP